MDLDQLQTFTAIARGLSFSAAAEALYRSQPAISRRIELLEDELGVPLFERVRGGSILTEAGVALLPYAERALAAAKDAIEAVKAVHGGESGTLAVALVGTLANAGFTTLLKRFGQRYPNVRLKLQTASSREVTDLVQRGDATIGLRYFHDPSPGLVSVPVMEEALVVVGRHGHALADACQHQANELAGECWVTFPLRKSQESFARFLERKLLAAGLPDPEIIAIDSLTAQKRLVEAGLGVALLAESGVEEEIRQGSLCILDIPELRGGIPVTLIHRRDGYVGATAQAFMAMVCDPVDNEKQPAKSPAAPLT